MKKVLIIPVLLFLFITTPVSAQSTGSQDGNIPRTSGFVDENGDPISIEEYERIRAEESKGVVEKYPLATAAVVILLIGGATFLIIRRTKKHS